MTDSSDRPGPERGPGPQADSPADSQPDAGTEPEPGGSAGYDGQEEPSYVSDDQLPEDLRPSEDNPLARPADDSEGSGGVAPPADGS